MGKVKVELDRYSQELADNETSKGKNGLLFYTLSTIAALCRYALNLGMFFQFIGSQILIFILYWPHSLKSLVRHDYEQTYTREYPYIAKVPCAGCGNDILQEDVLCKDCKLEISLSARELP